MFYALNENNVVKFFASKTDRDQFANQSKLRHALTSKRARVIMIERFMDRGYNAADFRNDYMSTVRAIYARETY